MAYGREWKIMQELQEQNRSAGLMQTQIMQHRLEVTKGPRAIIMHHCRLKERTSHKGERICVTK